MAEDMNKTDYLPKEINRISKEVESLKVTVVGMDGSNGMREQIKTLTGAMAQLQDKLDHYFKILNEMQSRQDQIPYIYATKEELRKLQEQILTKLESMDKKRDEANKDREAKRQAEERREKDLKHIRMGLWISIAGILLTTIFNTVRLTL